MAYNYTYLQALYKSIPNASDIRWWICYRDHLKDNRPAFEDTRVIVIESNDEDDKKLWNGSRLNMVFSMIPDGQFYVLDEDTLCHPNLYKLYKEYENFDGLVLAQQMCSNGRLRFNPGIPTSCCIDTGSGLCHSSALKHIQWGTESDADFVFWDKCYKYFGRDKTKYVHQPISYYNFQVPAN